MNQDAFPLDNEWILLMQEAKSIGLAADEVAAFLQRKSLLQSGRLSASRVTFRVHKRHMQKPLLVRTYRHNSL